MVHYGIIENPFKATETTIKCEGEDGISIGLWLARNQEKWDHLGHDLVCVHLGKEVPTDMLYKTYPEDGDVVVISPKVNASIVWVVVAIAVAVATYLAFSLLVPKVPGTGGASDPVYSLRGKSNQSKLNSAIERCYGRVRMYPAYGATPYNQYIGNDQYQYQLFVLGHGYIDPTTCIVQIEDTDILNLEDVVYEIYTPGQRPDLFPDNVNTVAAVNNIQLYGTGVPEYPLPDGWYGGFAVCDAGETVHKIEFDLALPQGLYRINSDGDRKDLNIQFEAEYREIYDVGTPVGSWTQFVSESLTLRTIKAYRKTYSFTVPSEARYEVRLRRTDSDDSNDSKRTDTTYWEQLRGFRPTTQDYSGLSMLAVRAKATNNFNDQSSRKINVIGTWQTEVWDGTNWNLETNRSAVWAFVDIFRSTYGADAADDYLNLCELQNIDVELFDQGKTFDWIFDQRTTTWEAAKVVARAVRGTPIPQGIKVSMKIDKPQGVIDHMFTPRNIVKGTLQRQISLAKPDAHDGLTVEYTDPNTYLPEQVDCLLTGDAGNRTKKVILAGITDRDLAYREGLYIRATEKFQKENITFQTGLEGRPVKYGDLMGVAHDDVQWSQTGYVTDITGTTITLSQNVTFGVGVHRLILKNRLGGGEIYEVTAGVNPNEVIATTTPDNTYPLDEYVEDQAYAFGEVESEVRLYKVVQVKPMGGDKVSITGVEYKDEIYQYDDQNAPPLDKGSVPPTIPDAPEVTGLTATTNANQLTAATALWQPALGADSYVFQRSDDGVNWGDEIVTTVSSYVFPVEPNEQVYIRVAGVGKMRGAWATWDGILGNATITPGNPSGFILKTPFNGLAIDTEWQEANVADSYQITTFALPADTQIKQETVSGTSYLIDYDDIFAATTPVRDYRLELVAQNSIGDSDGTETLVVNNPPPPVLSGISHLIESESDTQALLRVSWGVSSATDLEKYQLWASLDDGFTPDGSNIQYEGSSNVATFFIDKDPNGKIPDIYFVIAAKDVWGDDVNYSAQQLIEGNQFTLVDEEDNELVDDENNTLTS